MSSPFFIFERSTFGLTLKVRCLPNGPSSVTVCLAASMASTVKEAFTISVSMAPAAGCARAVEQQPNASRAAETMTTRVVFVLIGFISFILSCFTVLVSGFGGKLGLLNLRLDGGP